MRLFFPNFASQDFLNRTNRGRSNWIKGFLRSETSPHSICELRFNGPWRDAAESIEWASRVVDSPIRTTLTFARIKPVARRRRYDRLGVPVRLELLMKSQITKLAIVCVTSFTIGSSTCQAGPILDWLFPNRASRRAASNAGRLTYRIPVNAYQYNMSGYSPTTAYRSVWAPVPVTQYRPVGYVNPLSTGTQTNMLPCSSSEWQARRVPYTSYRPSTLFSGGSGWQGGQWLPIPSYNSSGFQPTTAGYPGAQVGYDQGVGWRSTTTNYGATPISSDWQTVGSGVSYATPSGTTGLLSIDDSRVTQAGYPDGNSFTPGYTTPDYANSGYSSSGRVTPLPSSMDSSWQPISEREISGVDANWRPADTSPPSSATCENCPSTTGSTNRAARSTDWEPVEPSTQTPPSDRDYRDRRDQYDRSRTRVTPADRAPELPDTQERRYSPEYDSERARRDDLYRWERIREHGGDDLTPVRRPDAETETMYRPPRTLGVNRQPVRRAITRQSDPYYERENSDAVYRRPSKATPTETRPVPFPKPIPDLNRTRRQQNVQRPVAPIPSLLDDSEERTANMNQVAPDRRAVPIDWNVVDIDRQGGLTRVKASKSRLTPVIAPPIDLVPPQNEGGWRRVR